MSVKMDELAERLYADFASACADPALKELFARLSCDEGEHLGWWRGLLADAESRILPEPSQETAPLLERLTAIYDELSALDPADVRAMTPEEMLRLALRLEFNMIDPLFSELIDAAGLTRAESMKHEYEHHIETVVDAISEHFAEGSLAHMLAQGLSRIWADNHRLVAYATHDALTGLHNRHALYSQLPQWAAWSARYGHSLAVLLIDVDHFKTINDRHGHTVGDEALRVVARALRESVRASDLVVRFGGDEFAVVAPETDADEYLDLCARITGAVEDLAFADESGMEIPLSVSIGGAISTQPAGTAPQRADRLIIAADQSLYAAKNSGRHRAAAPIVVSAV